MESLVGFSKAFRNFSSGSFRVVSEDITYIAQQVGAGQAAVNLGMKGLFLV